MKSKIISMTFLQYLDLVALNSTCNPLLALGTIEFLFLFLKFFLFTFCFKKTSVFVVMLVDWLKFTANVLKSCFLLQSQHNIQGYWVIGVLGLVRKFYHPLLFHSMFTLYGLKLKIFTVWKATAFSFHWISNVNWRPKRTLSI